MEVIDKENEHIANLAHHEAPLSKAVELGEDDLAAGDVSNAQARSSVDPKEISNVFEQVGKIFLRKSAHWTDRLEALSKVRQLAIAGAAEHDEFVVNLAKLKDQFLIQLKDLRSAIVREACTTVSEVAFSFKRHGSQKNHLAFISLATSMVDVCLKQAVVTIKVISKSAQECIKNIVESIGPYGSHSLLLRFVKGSQEKSSIVRHVCVEYIATALNCWPSSVFAKRFEEVSSTIVRTLDDADELVRRSARQCFWCLEKIFKEEAQEMLDTLSAATRRRLMDAQESSQSSTKSKKMSLPARFVSKPSNPQHGEGPKRTQHLSLKRPVRIQQQQATKVETVQRKMDYKPENYASASDASTKTQPIHRIHGAQRILHNSGPVAHVASHLGGAVRVGTQARARQHSKPESTSPRAAISGEEDRFHVARVTEHPIETETPADIRTLLLDTDSKVWSTRLEAFGKLKDMFEPLSKEGRRAALNKPATSKLVSVFLERVGDPHYRVVQVAYSFFCMVLEFISQEVEQQLERVLPNILTKLSDPKTQIRKVSNELLQVCTRVFPHDLLCSVLVGICKSKGDKLRLGVLEYLAVLMPTSKHYFHHAHLKMLVQRVVPYLRSRKTVLKAAATKVLVAAFHFNQREFLHILRYEVSEEDRTFAVKFMAKDVERLQELVDTAEKIEHVIKVDPHTEEVHSEAAEETTDKTAECVEVPRLDGVTPTEESGREDSQSSAPSLPTGVDVSATLGELSLGEAVQKKLAIQQIDRWIREKTLPNDLWATCGCQIVGAVIGRLKDSDVTMQELALDVLCSLIIHKYCNFVATTEVLFHQLLEYSKQEKCHSVYGASRAINLLAEHGDPARLLVLNVQLMSTENGIVLQLCIKALTILVTRIPTRKLLDTLPNFVPALCEAFSNKEPSIRKASMLCFVRLNFVLGECFLPFMNGLDQAQRKLVTIYIKKEEDAKKA